MPVLQEVPAVSFSSQGGCDLSIFARRTIILMVAIFKQKMHLGMFREWSSPGLGAQKRPGPIFGGVKRGQAVLG